MSFDCTEDNGAFFSQASSSSHSIMKGECQVMDLVQMETPSQNPSQKQTGHLDYVSEGKYNIYVMLSLTILQIFQFFPDVINKEESVRFIPIILSQQMPVPTHCYTTEEIIKLDKERENSKGYKRYVPLVIIINRMLTQLNFS
ncbi:hypothetical protein TURU_099958 [Turdus rufiventris]|nr:hypothetical protein TURU_099958 [Turdus rufiventris]